MSIWPSRDPIWEEGGANLYSSCLNRLSELVDPDGRDFIPHRDKPTPDKSLENFESKLKGLCPKKDTMTSWGACCAWDCCLSAAENMASSIHEEVRMIRSTLISKTGGLEGNIKGKVRGKKYGWGCINWRNRMQRVVDSLIQEYSGTDGDCFTWRAISRNYPWPADDFSEHNWVIIYGPSGPGASSGSVDIDPWPDAGLNVVPNNPEVRDEVTGCPGSVEDLPGGNI